MPFTKGDPNINREGRPKGSFSITSEIKKKLEEVPEGQKKSYLLLLIDRIMKQAIIDGDSRMIEKIWAYIDGMPKQSLEMGLDEELSQIEVKIVRNATEGDKDIRQEPPSA
jgi:hypothetical protein